MCGSIPICSALPRHWSTWPARSGDRKSWMRTPRTVTSWLPYVAWKKMNSSWIWMLREFLYSITSGGTIGPHMTSFAARSSYCRTRPPAWPQSCLLRRRVQLCWTCAQLQAWRRCTYATSCRTRDASMPWSNPMSATDPCALSPMKRDVR